VNFCPGWLRLRQLWLSLVFLLGADFLPKQLELKDESMSTNENPLGGRGRSEEERWARQQQQEAIEKMKKAGTAGKDAGASGDKSSAPASAPGNAPAKAPAKDSKK
jgi:hypothetical protein